MSQRGRLSFLVLLLAALLVVLAVLPQTRFFLTGIFRMEHWYLGQPTSYWEEALKAGIQAGKKWEQDLLQSVQTTKKLPPAGKRPSPEIGTRLKEGGEDAFPVLVELLKVPDAELQHEVTRIMFGMEPKSQEMADDLASTLSFKMDAESVGFVVWKVIGYNRETGLAALRAAIAKNQDSEIREQCELVLATQEKNETAKQAPKADKDDEKPAPVKIPQSALDDLLKKYRQIGLPLPPADSQLVRFQQGWSTTDDKGKDIPFKSLGFLVRPATERKPAWLLVGTELFEPPGYHDPKITVVSENKGDASNFPSEKIDASPLFSADRVSLPSSRTQRVRLGACTKKLSITSSSSKTSTWTITTSVQTSNRHSRQSSVSSGMPSLAETTWRWSTKCSVKSFATT